MSDTPSAESLKGAAAPGFIPTLQIDREGFLLSEGVRYTNAEFGSALLDSLTIAENGRYEAHHDGVVYWVESFDLPLLLTDLSLEDEEWAGTGVYGSEFLIPLNELKLDQWDRVCGRTTTGIPFVLSRAAQATLFDSADELTDDSISIDGTTVIFEPWTWEVQAPSAPEFWNQYYTAKDALPWELPGSHPALEAMLKQMKPPRSRISVFGSGGGHDAAYLAQQSHIVKAYDFSSDAIALAKNRYAQVSGLEFIQQDVLAFPKRLHGMSDIVVEHTLFCAISPTRRKELVSTWTRALAPDGYLVGIFFVMDRTQGPPFGVTEFEIQELLRRDYRFIYWNRWKASVPKREGIELVVVAQKKSGPAL